jgi:hypothetical protein
VFRRKILFSALSFIFLGSFLSSAPAHADNVKVSIVGAIPTSTHLLNSTGSLTIQFSGGSASNYTSCNDDSGSSPQGNIVVYIQDAQKHTNILGNTGAPDDFFSEWKLSKVLADGIQCTIDLDKYYVNFRTTGSSSSALGSAIGPEYDRQDPTIISAPTTLTVAWRWSSASIGDWQKTTVPVVLAPQASTEILGITRGQSIDFGIDFTQIQSIPKSDTSWSGQLRMDADTGRLVCDPYSQVSSDAQFIKSQRTCHLVFLDKSSSSSVPTITPVIAYGSDTQKILNPIPLNIGKSGRAVVKVESASISADASSVILSGRAYWASKDTSVNLQPVANMALKACFEGGTTNYCKSLSTDADGTFSVTEKVPNNQLSVCVSGSYHGFQVLSENGLVGGILEYSAIKSTQIDGCQSYSGVSSDYVTTEYFDMKSAYEMVHPAPKSTSTASTLPAQSIKVSVPPIAKWGNKFWVKVKMTGKGLVGCSVNVEAPDIFGNNKGYSGGDNWTMKSGTVSILVSFPSYSPAKWGVQVGCSNPANLRWASGDSGYWFFTTML